jgi:hypothetical protein
MRNRVAVSVCGYVTVNDCDMAYASTRRGYLTDHRQPHGVMSNIGVYRVLRHPKYMHGIREIAAMGSVGVPIYRGCIKECITVGIA